MTRHLKYSTSLTTLKWYPLLLSLNGGVAFYVHSDLSYERSETTLATRDGWGTPSKRKAAGTITKKFSNILHKCNQEPSLFETDERN